VTPSRPTASAIRQKLRAKASPANVAILQRFFKTGPGEYGEGDEFIGVKVPALRAVCRDCRGASQPVIATLLRSPIHEERLLALLLLVDAFSCATEAEQRRIYGFYLSHTAFINNWDLVDASAPYIVGSWLRERSRAPLKKLARSRLVWERRIAIVSTFDFLRHGEIDETLRIADLLLHDRHDLIHKAVGWLLREAGKRDEVALRRYLKPRYKVMPRTMLRYAIERFPPTHQKRYLTGRA
jgi:3-methyladenine DNA glycosylase AlkD